MKHLLFILFMCLGGTGFAQEGVEVKGNTLTTKEIPPVWPGCEDVKIEKKACFKQKLTEHLKAHYKFPKDEQGNLVRGKAVVSFNVNEEGKVEVLAVDGAKKELNAEAKRIILAIPKMKPGERAGKPIAVKYKVPFIF